MGNGKTFNSFYPQQIFTGFLLLLSLTVKSTRNRQKSDKNLLRIESAKENVIYLEDDHLVSPDFLEAWEKWFRLLWWSELVTNYENVFSNFFHISCGK